MISLDLDVSVGTPDMVCSTSHRSLCHVLPSCRNLSSLLGMFYTSWLSHRCYGHVKTAIDPLHVDGQVAIPEYCSRCHGPKRCLTYYRSMSRSLYLSSRCHGLRCCLTHYRSMSRSLLYLSS